MKIDLDNVERKARASVGSEWEVNSAGDVVCDNADDIAKCSEMGWSDARCRANALHIAANSPPVTLAMIARIRELEGQLRGLARPELCGQEIADALMEFVEKGAVLT